MARPPRHDGISYRGRHTFLITTTTLHRINAFTNSEFAPIAVAQLLKHAEKHQYSLPAYVYMPDHAHVVAAGLSADSDLEKFVYAWKKGTGFEWHKIAGGRLWQEGYWDRRLRVDGSIAAMIEYVIQNPVRAGIVDHPSRYLLTGSTLYTMEEMLAMTTSGDKGGANVPPSR
jgi:putative transposase